MASKKSTAKNVVIGFKKWKNKASSAKTWMFTEYSCSGCNYRVREHDREKHDAWHAERLQPVMKATVKENVVAQREHAERRARQRSATVAAEQARRGRQPVVTTATAEQEAPQPVVRESARQRARRTWATQVDQRSQVMTGAAPPQNEAQRVAATGPAGYIQAAGRMIIDFEPTTHTEQKEFALAMNVALGDLARAVEAYQDRRVRERFHPNCIRPLDLVVNGLTEIRVGFVHMILTIERHYQAHFEAARQGGPVPGQQQGPGYFDEAAG